MRQIFRFVNVYQSRHKVSTPHIQVQIQLIVPWVDIQLRMNVLHIGVNKLGFKWNCSNTSPCTSIHCIDGRECITQHKDFTSNLELCLFLKQTTSFYIIFSCKLFHTRGIERLPIIWFGHVNESFVTNRHDIRVRSPCIRAFTSHGSGL